LDGPPEQLSHLVALTEAANLLTDPIADGAEKSLDLAENYREIAETRDCYFMAASQHIKSSDVSGVHLMADQHEIFGITVAAKVMKTLG